MLIDRGERRIIAKSIASMLFTDIHTGEVAKRFVREPDGKKIEGAGYCEEAVVDSIIDLLDKLSD